MFAKIEAHEISPEKIWDGDLFKRQAYAKTLCDLLKSTAKSNVIGLSAPYGFGKTFFLRRLREQIKGEGGWAVYVNAWEYDYLDNPLFGILDALKVAARELPDYGKTKKALRKIAVAAAPAVAKAASKKLMEKVLGADGTEEVIDAVAEASGKATEALIAKYLEEDTTHHALNALRNEIESFVKNNIAKESSYKSLIIIVDELDRARPNFSIRFLETIKHIFGTAKVIFIIGCDKGVLGSSARHEYGSDLEIDGYLRRLFDFWLELPSPDLPTYISHCAKELGLVEENILTMNGNMDSDLDRYADYLIFGSNGKKMSLRFVEQSICHMNVLVRTLPTNSYKHIALVGWLQGVRFFDENAYQKYISSTSFDSIFSVTKGLPGLQKMDTEQQGWIVAWAFRNGGTTNLDEAKITFGEPLGNRVKELLSDGYFGRAASKSFAEQVDVRIRTIAAQVTR